MCSRSHVHRTLQGAHGKMIAKLFVLSLACAAAVGAPGLLNVGYGAAVAPAYGAAYAAPAYGAAYAAPAYGAAYAAPAITAHAIAAPVVKTIAAPVAVHAETIDPNPAYSFSYGVSDPHTGDQKDAAETLQNGVVHGSYSLVEPDGHLRRVTYTADKINGFNAVVERTGGAHAVAPAPIAKVIAAPAHVAVAAPVARYTLPAAIGHVGVGVAHPWG